MDEKVNEVIEKVIGDLFESASADFATEDGIKDFFDYVESESELLINTSISEIISRSEIEVMRKVQALCEDLKESFNNKIEKIKQNKHEELRKLELQHMRENNSKCKYSLISKDALEDKYKIASINKFFEENAGLLNGVTFTKNKLANALREGMCPPIQEEINSTNVLYLREQIIYYIISQMISGVHSEKRSLLLSRLWKNKSDVYEEYKKVIQEMNSGYDTYSKMLDPINKAISEAENYKKAEKEKKLAETMLEIYGFLAGGMKAVEDAIEVSGKMEKNEKREEND